MLRCFCSDCRASFTTQYTYLCTVGQYDEILPVSCSHRILHKLESYGYEVKYEEFTGGHELKEALVRGGLEVFLTPNEGK
ncbi:hypothetical protein EON65_42930 [archaeon]|nr:MAG: hypothetical protein EON65_42930 [archaeon]